MKSSSALSVLVFTLLAAASVGGAQEGALRDTSGPIASLDPEWESLRSLGRPRATIHAASNDPAAVVRAREQAVAELITDADKLRAFRARHPKHAQVREAKRLEALALLNAFAAGDATQTQRRHDLVAEVRTDRALPSRARSEVAAFSDNLEVQQRPGLTRETRLKAFEEVVRRLIAEYPDVPTGYESLLRIASAQSEAAALRTAGELKDQTAAPEEVRQEASMIVARAELVGKNLAEILEGLEVREALPEGLNRPIVLYSWATWSEASVDRARKLATRAPSDAWLIGINLDVDDAVAKNRVNEASLAGAQLYNRARREGAFAQVLAMNVPGLVYIIDKTGKIVSTSAQRDLEAALAALAKP